MHLYIYIYSCSAATCDHRQYLLERERGLVTWFLCGWTFIHQRDGDPFNRSTDTPLGMLSACTNLCMHTHTRACTA